MKHDNTITIWHYEDDFESPLRKVFLNVCKSHTKKISKNGIKQKGFYMGDSSNIRIFTVEEIGITPGDYLMEGVCLSTYPDRENGQKVVEVRDNRIGANPHWHIICGG